MKIKLSLLFSFLFYFATQTGLCNAQDVPDLGTVININDTELETIDEGIEDTVNFPESSTAELPESNMPELPEDDMQKLPENNSIETQKTNNDSSLKATVENLPEKKDNSNNDNIKSLKDLDKSSSQASSNNNKVIEKNIPNDSKSNVSKTEPINTNNTKGSILSNTTTTPKKRKNNRVFTSLMFSEENIREIFKALPASTIGIPDQYIGANLDTTPTINGNTTDDTETNTTSFFIYLNSIMYISKDAWSIWINNNKITNLTNDNNDINVIEISPLYVLIGWKITPLQWESINTNNKISEGKYKIYDNYVELFIRLSPNQTYLPSKNQIIEGMPDIDISSQNTSDNMQNNTVLNEETEDLFF